VQLKLHIKNVKINRVFNIPKIGGFLPIVPILTALSALGSLASGSAAIAKTINNARMAKEDMEDTKSHYRKVENGEGPCYGFYLKPYTKGKGIKMRKNKFLCYLLTYSFSALDHFKFVRNISHNK